VTDNTLALGRVSLPNPFILAPMAGVSDPPFRRLCRQRGAGMVCAEMVSANALHHGDETSLEMLTVFPDEHPVSMQLFGSSPDRLAEAAKRAVDAGADIVDLNCGCPVPKITKSGAGMSLMKDEALFGRCIEAMARSVDVPVTVKMRTGWVRGENVSARLAQIAERAGAAAVSVHARTMENRHSGPPDLVALAETVQSVHIPVFGNGGVASLEEGRRMMGETGCAAVLIGQAAMGDPFVFQEGAAHRAMERFAKMEEHVRFNVDYYGERRGLSRFRKFLHAYTKGLPDACAFRNRCYTVESLKDFMEIMGGYQKTIES
jgi:tRNA-dihydrouridine synthase B